LRFPNRYIEVKKETLSHSYLQIPINKRLGIEYNTPVLMTILAIGILPEKILGRNQMRLERYRWILKFKPPKTFLEKINLFQSYYPLERYSPKRVPKVRFMPRGYNSQREIDLD